MSFHSAPASLHHVSDSQSDHHVHFDPLSISSSSSTHNSLHSPPPHHGWSAQKLFRNFSMPLPLLHRLRKKKFFMRHAKGDAFCCADKATQGAPKTTREIRLLDDVRRVPLDWLPLPAIHPYDYTLLPLETAMARKDITHHAFLKQTDVSG